MAAVNDIIKNSYDKDNNVLRIKSVIGGVGTNSVANIDILNYIFEDSKIRVVLV